MSKDKGQEHSDKAKFQISNPEASDASISADVSTKPHRVKPEPTKKTLMKLIDHLLHYDINTIKWTTHTIITILDRVKDILIHQETCVRVRAPIKIVGDIHGQFTDLKRLFKANGYLPEVKYLFLGDYVDRGNCSLETIMLLFCLKALYPESIILLRGNHECLNINRVYGFFDELQRRSLVDCYTEFNATFDHLPITALVSGCILCMHGGISQYINNINDVKNLPRPISMMQGELDQTAVDLLWADPKPNQSGYKPSMRGVGYTFGLDVLDQFCQNLNIELVVRAHQVVPKGFERFPAGQKTRLVTVFSAPNYCSEMDNSAAVMSVDDKLTVHFNVLEPSADPESVKERESQRKNIPAYDSFPEATDAASKVVNHIKNAVHNIAKQFEKK